MLQQHQDRTLLVDLLLVEFSCSEAGLLLSPVNARLVALAVGGCFVMCHNADVLTQCYVVMILFCNPIVCVPVYYLMISVYILTLCSSLQNGYVWELFIEDCSCR